MPGKKAHPGATEYKGTSMLLLRGSEMMVRL